MTLKFTLLCIFGVIIIQADNNAAATIKTDLQPDPASLTEAPSPIESPTETQAALKGNNVITRVSSSKQTPAVFIIAQRRPTINPVARNPTSTGPVAPTLIYIPAKSMVRPNPDGTSNPGTQELTEFSSGEKYLEERALTPLDVVGNTATGLVTGAGLGATIGGPPGAIIGAGLGLAGSVLYNAVDLLTGVFG